jgi:hypothetical protein
MLSLGSGGWRGWEEYDEQCGLKERSRENILLDVPPLLVDALQSHVDV